MSKRMFVMAVLTAFLLIPVQATRILAGTTGSLTGQIISESGTGLAGAKVAASSPSESVVTTTGADGHFAFVSLPPDTYTVTVSKDGYQTISQPGVTVVADNNQVIRLSVEPTAKVLGHVTATAVSGLVKAGTTADVYAIDATMQAKVASLGGGGSLDQAYGSLAITPGVVVPPGGTGWFQTVHIRGGDYDQVGYEFDGVPVLRTYDNYPTTNASALGQQQLQVYTGAAPANSESQGLAGYINQVIKTGTYPGFASAEVGVGFPAQYGKANIEIGGATPNRSFSYYVAVGGSQQSFRWFDQFNGASLQSLWGTPFAQLPCPGDATSQNFASCYKTGIGPGGYALAPPIASFNVAQTWDYENVFNFHFAIPHRNDSGRDDIQLLYDTSYLHNTYYSSASDWGVTGDPLLQKLNGASSFGYLSGPGIGYQYLGAAGTQLAAGSPAQLQALVPPYYFPYNPDSTKPPSIFGAFAAIPTNLRDGTANPNSIIKLQYQRNIGTSAYFRIYGYDDYSVWPQTCPNTAWTNYIGYCPLNYYVQSRTKGFSASFADQVTDKHLLNIEASDVIASDYRANDNTMLNEFVGLNKHTGADSFAYAVNSSDPTSGVCYTPTGTAVSCYSANAASVGLFGANQGSANLTLPSSCGSGPCEWFVAETGRHGGGNSSNPNFGAASITDQWKVTPALLLNLGMRFDRYYYKLSDTGGAARDFWFNAWNNSYCVLPGPGHVPFYNAANDATAGSACPIQNGVQTVAATMTNLPNDSTAYNILQPRLGGTYTVNSDNVLRFSYGKYTQAPNSAFEQYNLLQQDLASYDAFAFWPIGFTTTTHNVRPATSDNVDFSWEHRVPGTDVSFKLTPYLRRTHDQIQNFFLDQKTGFISGLNAGNQTADGVEFQLSKGDFNRNGLSGLLAVTYTHSFIRFSALNTGGSVLSTINTAIQQYNSFTGGCATATPSSDPNAPCGAFGSVNAIAVEASGVANPYFNAPTQPLFDVNANYLPFSTIPGGVESASASYITPLNMALVLNFKHDKWSFSPQFQYFQGGYYGAPLSGWGVNPSTCATLAGSTAGDPRYPYGATGGSPYDALTCGASNVSSTNPSKIAVPDPFTRKFDNLGAFKQPNQLLMHLQIGYEVSPRITMALNLANLINRCSGGDAEPWTRYANSAVCGYGLPGYASLPYGANIYNPGSSFQPIVQFPYQENPTISPFNAYLDVKVKL
jgi:carboxypeptidase family protein/TonB-dependent receptor-like protein